MIAVVGAAFYFGARLTAVEGRLQSLETLVRPLPEIKRTPDGIRTKLNDDVIPQINCVSGDNLPPIRDLSMLHQAKDLAAELVKRTPDEDSGV